MKYLLILSVFHTAVAEITHCSTVVKIACPPPIYLITKLLAKTACIN